jgi:type IV pilus biogenesis protein CpaD/CtpE
MWIAVAAVSLVACGTRAQGVNGSPLAIPDLQGISEFIASTARYPAITIEIASSARRLRISIRDAKLAVSDEGTRNAAGASPVAASEQVLASHPDFSTLEAISVAVIHGDAAADGAAGKDWHIEDVVEFRKGPSGRFSVHIT